MHLRAILDPWLYRTLFKFNSHQFQKQEESRSFTLLYSFLEVGPEGDTVIQVVGNSPANAGDRG